MSAEKSRIVEFVSFVMSTRWIETINKDKRPAQKLPGTARSMGQKREVSVISDVK